MDPITLEQVQHILDKPENVRMKQMGINNPQQLISGVSSAANPRDGSIIKFEEFEARLNREDANAQERSLIKISVEDKLILFTFLQQQHKSNPTIATSAELQEAYSTVSQKSAAAEARDRVRQLIAAQEAEAAAASAAKSHEPTKVTKKGPTKKGPTKKGTKKGGKGPNGGSRKKTHRRKSNRRRNKTSRRRC